MKTLVTLTLILGLSVTAGCDLCWPRGGALGRCVGANDDDTANDDDAANDDDSGDDDDVANDDDSTEPRPPCIQGEIVTGPAFTIDIGGGPTVATYDFVCIEPDSFFMGFDFDDPGFEEGEESHEVTFTRTILVGLWEVPQALWTEVMGSNPSDCSEPDGCTDLTPVNRISWSASQEFANQLSSDQGLSPVYTQPGGIPQQDLDLDGYRLPTEAEWEYAARGGEDYEYSGSDDVNDVAWCDAFSDRWPKPVGLKLPNAYGIFDMSGNISEWCWDGYADYDLEPQTDPEGAIDPNFRVRRGGNFDYQCPLTRVRNRSYDTPGGGINNQGLRLVRTVFVPAD